MQIDVKVSKEYLHDLAKNVEDDTTEDERVKFDTAMLEISCENLQEFENA